MLNNPAENQTETLQTAKPQEDQDENQDALFGDTKKSELTQSEIEAVQRRETSIDAITNERNRKAHRAKEELAKLTSSSNLKETDRVISREEEREYSERIQKTKSAEKMQTILDEITRLPDERKILEKDDPQLEELKAEFDECVDDNVQYIGTKQVDGFKKWFEEQMNKKPQVKHLKDLIKRLKGEQSTDSGGLYPRREEYTTLKNLFKKYDLKEPTDSKYIEEEGLKERKEYRKNAETIENHLMRVKETGFYSKEVIQETMQQALTADSPSAQKEIKTQLDKISRLESEGFTHLDSKITVGGITIRKMSQKGKDFLINYYKTIGLDEREENVRMWPKFVEDEAELAEDLLEIYEDHPEGFRLAMGSFQHLTFDEKEKALKEHERMVKETADKEELEKKLTIKAAHGAIDEAARKGIIAKGEERTQGKYKEFFEDDENFKNPKTGEEGDLGELKKAYALLINPSPNRKYKNLAAYEQQRKEYQKAVKKLGEYDDDMEEEDLAELQAEFDESGWTDREDLHEDIKKKVEKAKERHDKMKRLTKGAEKKDLEKRKKPNKEEGDEEEKGPSSSEAAIKAANKLLMEERPLEALEIITKYLKNASEKNPDAADDPKALFWLEKIAEYIREFGTGKKKIEESFEAKLEEEIQEEMEDEETKRDIVTEQLEELSLEGTEESERLHGDKKSAKERAKEESLSRTGTTSLEAQLTKDFYENSDEEFILDEEGKGEETTELQFDDKEYEKEEVVALKKEVYHKQDKLREHRGLVDTVLKDKDGKVITTKEARAIQQKDTDALEKDITESIEENMKAKKGEDEAQGFTLTQEIAAKRKVKTMLNKRLHEKLESEY
ncbi:MAG: hypothetical protein WC651_00435 [Candidatus Gracilibacteria bacterium]|jgi:hypothetical protein